MGDAKKINPAACYEPGTDTVHINKDASSEVKVQAMTFALDKKIAQPGPELHQALDAAAVCKAGEVANAAIHFPAKSNGLKFTP